MRALYAPADVRVKLLVFCAKMGSSERVKSLHIDNERRPIKATFSFFEKLFTPCYICGRMVN